MGACICKNAPYTKPYEVQSLDNKDIASSLESPNPAQDGDGLTRHNKTKSIVETIKISSMSLCDKDTTDICEPAMRLITVLSIYHQFINEYIDYIEEDQRRQTRSNNLLNMINDRYPEYDLITLRDDYHHLITYHESNKDFMKKLFYQLMEQNHVHSIDNLAKINKKLDRDQEKQTYFGHKMSDEIRFMQTLNQVHYDITNKFQSAEDIAAVLSDEETEKDKDPEIDDEDQFIQDNFGMNIDEITAGRQRSTAHTQLLDDDDTKSGSDIQRKDTNTSMTSQSTTTGTEDEDEDEEEEDEDKISLPKPRNRYKMKKNRMGKKRGFYKGAAVDDDDNKGGDNIRIDVKYEKGTNKQRKVGRLKMRKPQQKYQPVAKAKAKAGKAKIVNDDSWVDQSQQKKREHVVSQSIMNLGSTKLVTNNSFKEMATLSEDHDHDDANFKPEVDFKTLDMSQFNEDISFTRRRSAGVSRTEDNSRFDNGYDIDQD